MYVYYSRVPTYKRMFTVLGEKFAPIVFMSMHVGMFLFSSVFAIASYYSFYVNTFFMLTWILLSIWNGANFYMEYFAKKYEVNLKRLDQIE